MQRSAASSPNGSDRSAVCPTYSAEYSPRRVSRAKMMFAAPGPKFVPNMKALYRYFLPEAPVQTCRPWPT